MDTQELIWNVKKDAVEHRVKKGKRIDGRKNMESRDINITKGIIGTAEGSAKVELGDTKVIAGVKLGTGEPYSNEPDQGVLITNSELYPIASPSFETGPPREDTVELARVVDRGIRESEMVDLGELCIEPKEKVWMVFLDIFPLDQDGNLIDASAIAAVAALENAKIPEYEDGEINRDKMEKDLPITDTPVAKTFSKIDGGIVLDPELREEKAQDSRITVYINDKGNVCATQKGGNGSFKRDEINKVIKESIPKASETREKILESKE